ncbi:hypothetical protein BGX27_005868 [Mortierella sp. AM989]|nr:hypothetical protein BGX27_005868 [Mortierella sp. AM989]
MGQQQFRPKRKRNKQERIESSHPSKRLSGQESQPQHHAEMSDASAPAEQSRCAEEESSQQAEEE